MILKNGADVGITALKELTGWSHPLLTPPTSPADTSTSKDQVTDPSIPPKVYAYLLTLRDPSLPPLPAFSQPSPTTLHSHSHSDSPPPSPTLSSTKVLPGTLPILGIPSIRIFSSGPSFLADIQLELPGTHPHLLPHVP